MSGAVDALSILLPTVQCPGPPPISETSSDAHKRFVQASECVLVTAGSLAFHECRHRRACADFVKQPALAQRHPVCVRLVARVTPRRGEHYCSLHLRHTLPWRRILALRSHEATIIMLHRADVGSVISMGSGRGTSDPSIHTRAWQPPEPNATRGAWFGVAVDGEISGIQVRVQTRSLLPSFIG